MKTSQLEAFAFLQRIKWADGCSSLMVLPIITNIGQDQKIDELLQNVGAGDYFNAGNIAACCHERNTDEFYSTGI